MTTNLQERDAKTEPSGDFKSEEVQERHAGAKRLQVEYQELARQHPDIAVYQWALGYIEN